MKAIIATMLAASALYGFYTSAQVSRDIYADIVGTGTSQKWAGDKLNPESATPLGVVGLDKGSC